MRTLLTSILLLPVFALAEPVTVEKPVVCNDVKTVIELLSGRAYQEKPFWVGKDTASRYVLMVNENTKTWTIIQFNDEFACVIGTGEGHTRVLTGPKI
jgi:hypothetical protein